MTNTITEIVHASLIKGGDTIEMKGILYTVCEKDIHRGGFMGTSIFGITYFEDGHQMVKRIKFVVPTDSLPKKSFKI